MGDTKIKMIIVDDQALTSELDKAGYQQSGIKAEFARTFEEIEKKLQSKSFDLITINLDYHAMDNVQLCKYIKSTYGDQYPIIATSVKTSKKVKDSMKELGVNLFVEQPIPRHMFIQQIKMLLNYAVRTNHRAKALIDVSIKNTSDSQSYSSEFYDISSTGALVKGEYDMGQLFEIKFHIPGHKEAVSCHGRFVRNVQLKGEMYTALNFNDVSETAQNAIQEFVFKLQNESELKYYI